MQGLMFNQGAESGKSYQNESSILPQDSLKGFYCFTARYVWFNFNKVMFPNLHAANIDTDYPYVNDFITHTYQDLLIPANVILVTHCSKTEED